MVRLYTARVAYRGADRLDVTRKSGADAFAPSWGLLAPFLAQRRTGAITDAQWVLYVAGYTDEMRASYRAHRGAWDALLAEGEKTLCCYCTNPARCHRTILAALLTKLGATYAGER